jgi:hypothetical protein
MEEALAKDTANPNLAFEWVRGCLSQGRIPDLARLDRLLQQGEVGRRAIRTSVHGLAVVASESSRAAARLFRQALTRILDRHGEWLARDPIGWAVVGRALTQSRLTGRVLSWMASWRSQPLLTPELLLALVLHLRSVRRDAEAADLCRHALSLPEPDRATPALELWLALEEALEGGVETAGQRLGHLRAEELDAYSRGIHVLVRALVEAGTARASERPRVCRREFAAVKAAFPRGTRAGLDEPARRALRRVRSRLAELSGSWWRHVRAVA